MCTNQKTCREDFGRARTVKIFCPYVIYNQTGMNLDIAESKYVDGNGEGSASRNIFSSCVNEQKQAEAPMLFSFSNQRSSRHRIRARVDGSKWSEVTNLCSHLIHVERIDRCNWNDDCDAYEVGQDGPMVHFQHCPQIWQGSILYDQDDPCGSGLYNCQQTK